MNPGTGISLRCSGAGRRQCCYGGCCDCFGRVTNSQPCGSACCSRSTRSQEQLIALVFSHFFIVLSAFFTSLACSILATRHPKFYLPFTLLALLLSLVNLLSMEYFFLLELLRPALLWIVLGENEPDRKKRLRRTLFHSLPYLLLFLGVVIWRAFFFSFQTTNYDLTLLDNLKFQPLQTLFTLLLTVLKDIWLTSFGAWGQVFKLPNPIELGRLTTLVYAALVIGTAAGVLIYSVLFGSQRYR